MSEHAQIVADFARPIPRERLLIAHAEARRFVDGFAGETLTPTGLELIRLLGSPRGSGIDPYAVLVRLGNESALAPALAPATTLVLMLWWLTHPDLPDDWIYSWTIETGDPAVLASRRNAGVVTMLSLSSTVEGLFRDGSVAREVLLPHVTARMDDFNALLSGGAFAFGHLTAFTGVCLFVKEHYDAGDTWPIMSSAKLIADLNPALIGDNEA